MMKINNDRIVAIDHHRYYRHESHDYVPCIVITVSLIIPQQQHFTNCESCHWKQQNM